VKSATAILMSNLLITGAILTAVWLSEGDTLVQQIGLIALGLVLVVGIPPLIARWPPYEPAPGPSSAASTSAVFGMVHLPCRRGASGSNRSEHPRALVLSYTPYLFVLFRARPSPGRTPSWESPN
jgi:hypothetical protein